MFRGGVAACHRYGVCTGSMSQVWCVYWQHVTDMLCALFALNTANSTHGIPMTCCQKCILTVFINIPSK
jgi:hypothetical protein